jgi:alkane 1-monooxygenase
MKWYAYFLPLSFYFCSLLAFHASGIWAYSTLLFAFGVIASLELILKPNIANRVDEEMAAKNPVYRFLMIFFVGLNWLTLLYFFYIMRFDEMDNVTYFGRIVCMGLLCGVFGINIGHELGHHKSEFDRAVAKFSLLSSLYMHFYVEHNKGHHKHVATEHDPASARINEPIYLFYLRSIYGSFLSAWRIENKDCSKKYGSWLTPKNEMVQLMLIQGVFVFLIYLWGGMEVLIPFLLSALIGILLLESVNYIQHYGLSRELKASGQYERTQVYHSWDCHYPLGRMILFELTRHSDHHYLASRPYQIMRFHAEAPCLPFGYPSSILLALIPPLWFRVMNKRIPLQPLKNSIS